MTARKKVVWITACIIITAVLIVLCVELISGGKITEYDGTLVEIGRWLNV